MLYKINIPNGPLIIVKHIESPTLFGMYVATQGIQQERAGKEGVAHLSEHLNVRVKLSHGSNVNKAYMINGFTKRQYTGYTINTLSANANDVIDLFLNFHDQYENIYGFEAYIAKEIQNISFENKAAKSNMSTVVIDKMHIEMCHDNSFGNSMLSDKLRELSVKDVFDFLNDSNKSTHILILIGDISDSKYKPLMEPSDQIIYKFPQNDINFVSDSSVTGNSGYCFSVGIPVYNVTSYKQLQCANIFTTMLINKLRKIFSKSIKSICSLYSNCILIQLYGAVTSPISTDKLKTIIMSELSLINETNAWEELFDFSVHECIFNVFQKSNLSEYIANFILNSMLILNDDTDLNKSLVQLSEISFDDIKSFSKSITESDIHITII